MALKNPSRIPLTNTSRLVLNETVVHREHGRPPLLGCPSARRFLEVDDEALAAVEAIKAGNDLAAAERLLEEQTGEEYDVLAFAERLRDRGFVKLIDGVVVPPLVKKKHQYLSKVRPEWVSWIHHPLLILIVLESIVAWIASVAARPDLAPRFSDLVLSSDPAVVIATTSFGFLFFAYIHELSHFFMAKSYGIESAIRIYHRMLIPVLETDVTNAWILERPKQVRIFLAGIGFNLFVASVAGLLAVAAETGALSLPGLVPLLRFVVLVNVVPLSYQLMVFARTDIYYVLLVGLKERNLARDSLSHMSLRARHLMMRLRGARFTPCARCTAKTFFAEPFCLRCGLALDVENVDIYPIDWANRRRMFAFGLLFVVGQVLGFAYILTIGLWLQYGQAERSLSQLGAGLETGVTGDIVAAGVGFLFVVLQILIMVYFLGGGALRIIPWKRILGLGRPRPEPEGTGAK